MQNIITDEIVISYTQCKRKAFLLLDGRQDSKPKDIISLQEQKLEKYKSEYINALNRTTTNVKVLSTITVEWDDLRASANFLTQINPDDTEQIKGGEPIIFSMDQNVLKEHRLLLSFLHYVISNQQTKTPNHGRIVNPDGKTVKVSIEDQTHYFDTAISELRRWKQDSNQQPPEVLLNKHCQYCPFEEQCLYRAKEIDHLSLLRGMSQKEIDNQNKRGIFTVAQYSYTYKPRKAQFKGKRPIKYYHSLKALSIRNRKIYVVRKPEINISENLIFLDVEGVPNEDYYYLIGILLPIRLQSKNTHSGLRAAMTNSAFGMIFLSLWKDTKAFH